jgi:energy-coupling factor transport system ATP-binding protein
MNESSLVMDDVPENVFARADELMAMGLDIPEITRVFLRLKQMGANVPSVYTIDQAVEALRKMSGGTYHA